MGELAFVSLSLSNDADNVALVRQALSGVAEQLELAAGAINDIRTAATEACNNVVLHAYEGGIGLLEVEIECSEHALEVVVRDRGTGIRPLIRSRSDGALGIGLAIIQALARRVEFNDPPGGGTEVRMEFAAKPSGVLAAAKLLRDAPRKSSGADALASTATLAIAPSPLARSVLPRVLTVLAARARFTTDRIADVRTIAEMLAGDARAEPGGEIRLTVSVTLRRLELALGPLAEGEARELIEFPSHDGAGSMIESLSAEHRLDGAPGARESTLVLALADRV